MKLVAILTKVYWLCISKKNCLIFNIKVVEKILIINDKIIFLLSILSFNKCAVHT